MFKQWDRALTLIVLSNSNKATPAGIGTHPNLQLLIELQNQVYIEGARI